jgi:hypothetical protein
MKPPTILGLFLGMFFLSSQNARADIFVAEATFSTSGTFKCRASVPCSDAGSNIITIFGDGGTSATIAFSGVNTTMDVTNGITRVPIGEFSMIADEGFVFPTHADNPTGLPILRFVMTLNQTQPVAASGGKEWDFGPGGHETLPLQMGLGYFVRPAVSAAGNYSRIVYTVRPFPFTLNPNARTAIFADVGAVPEPASMMLLGTGLAGLIARKRRSASSSQSRG